MNSEINHRFFSAKGAALESVKHTINEAELVRIATAYFESSGYQLLQDHIAEKQVRLLIGRSEGGQNNMASVLKEFELELSTGDMRRRTRALQMMLSALQQGLLTISVGMESPDTAALMDARYLYHHAKLYMGDEKKVLVTSANFSRHGLTTSREAGTVVENTEYVRYFVNTFDEYFEQAQSITQPIIDKLLAWLKAYSPYQIYAKALMALYGLPDEEVSESLSPLAPYQKAVTSSVLASLQNHHGAFLVASTGLGKTYIAAHTVAYLRMKNQIDSVVVVCPAGLKEMWQRTMYASKTASEEFSYHTLSGDDVSRDGGVRVLKRLLSQLNDKTLLILDESHHLRNAEDVENEIRLRSDRILEAVHKKSAHILLMTATPYSKSIEDVNNQLMLLPSPIEETETALGLWYHPDRWLIKSLDELSDLSPSTVLTTPDVVRYFGSIDENNDRFVEFGDDDRRFFPYRITLRTVKYQNNLDDILVELLTTDLLHTMRVVPHAKEQSPLFDNKTMDQLMNGRGVPNHFYTSQVLHKFCSSPAQVEDLLTKMKTGETNFQFYDQQRLTDYIKKHQNRIHKASSHEHDSKLQELIEIIKEAKEEKVTVFCHYKLTASYLTEELKKALKGLSVDTTVGKSGSTLDKILQRFAPIANEVPVEDRDLAKDIQVLICTNAIAEGYNLQDSRILINYDLPWTVLNLAQRMGRILRPWSTPREVLIYNFIPSTMEHPDLRNARNWKTRLHDRSEQHRSFSQIPIMQQKDKDDDQGYAMEQLANELYVNEEMSLDLDEVLEFIETHESLTTSTFYKDLVNIHNSDEIKSLPNGIRSARFVNGSKRLFILFCDDRKNFHAGLFDGDGRLARYGDRRETAMKAIRCIEEEVIVPAHLYPLPDEFDDWIENARHSWAKVQEVQPQRLQIVCTMALIPNKTE